VVKVGVASDIDSAQTAVYPYAPDSVVVHEDVGIDDSCATQPPNYPDVNFHCGSLPFKGGLELEVDGARYPNCTAGFLAKNTETSVYGIITAGHCLYSHGGDTWYHNTTEIGPQKVYVWYGGADADVGFIRILDNNQMDDRNAILYNYPSSVDNIVATRGLSSQYAGEAVCRTGINYGYDCGAIVVTDVSRKSSAWGYTYWIHHTVEVDYDSSAGDSGGPMTTTCCANTNPPWVDTYALGTHVHSDPDNATDPHGWYSPIDEDISALNAASYTYMVCVTATC
jgi:Trypsin